MRNIATREKTYVVDDDGFLVNHEQWDEAFAKSLAPSLDIARLSDRHWQVIQYIRDYFLQYKRCPLVYETCRANNLRLRELRQLFPSGYLRGACRLAGVTYKEGYHGAVALTQGKRPALKEAREMFAAAVSRPAEKTYEVNVRGFLVDPDTWDEEYASLKAFEMGMEEPLSDRQWEIIHFLRKAFRKNGVVPTIYETCEANNLSIEDLEKLFPRGYHRGAVKLAGLRVR